MLSYSFIVAWQNTLKHLPLTALIVCTLGLGVGASVTMQTVLRTMTGDPVPGRSEVLFRPKLNPLPKSFNLESAPNSAPDNNLTWQDAIALIDQGPATEQAAMAGGELVVADPAAGASYAPARYATADFFPMFDIRPVKGRVWTADEDSNGARVAVITRALSERLYPGTTAVGKRIMLNELPFSVVGVVDAWRPWPKFHADLSTSAFAEPDQIFLPLHTAVNDALPVSGSITSWGKEESGSGMLKSATATWLQVWIKLESEEDVRRYSDFLTNFAAERHAQGIYERAPDGAELVGLLEWLERQSLVPENLKIQLWLAYAFLLVCAINASALLFSKFMSNEQELAIRRALGAKKRAIAQQLSIEGMMLGLAGGMVAIVVCQVGLWLIRRQPDDYSKLAYMDYRTILLAVGIGVASGLLAATIPAWRIARASAIKQLI